MKKLMYVLFALMLLSACDSGDVIEKKEEVGGITEKVKDAEISEENDDDRSSEETVMKKTESKEVDYKEQDQFSPVVRLPELPVGEVLEKDFERGIVFFAGYPLVDREIYAIAGMDYVDIAEASVEWKDVQKGPGEYDFAELDKVIDAWHEAGKKVDIRVMTANTSVFAAPEETILDLGIRMISEGNYSNFDDYMGSYTYDGEIQPVKGSKIGRGNQLFGKNSMGIKVIAESSDTMPVNPNEKYLVQFDYEILEDGNYFVRFISSKGIIEEKKFSGAKGDSGFMQLHAFNDSNKTGKIQIGIDGAGGLAIDNLQSTQTTNTRHKLVGYPNYFGDAFKKEYTAFVKALGERYNGHEGVYAVSVSGLGRWEEAILGGAEFGEQPGSVRSQWDEMGFTEKAYLEHIEWAMELHMAHFPDKRLKMQISPIFHGYENEDIGTRKVADLCARYGIDLKQNGMSEKYDTWGGESHASYVINKYRYDETTEIKATYETGGQMYNNFVNAMGHPLSLLNRTLIDGADYLYLYGLDLYEPNVSKYLHYANEQFGSPLFTKFYSRLGDYSQINQYNGDWVDYKNQWLGIRQHVDRSSMVDYVIKDGKKCVASYNGQDHNYKIVFDLDNRIQYNGMSGVTVSVEYFDEGTDSFEVKVLDQLTGRLRSLGLVNKTGTDTWQVASFYDDTFARSYKNRREDQVEIAIYDKKDGAEFISAVDIDFVPLMDYKKEIVAENGGVGSEKAVAVVAGDSFLIDVDQDMVTSLQVELFSAEPIDIRTDILLGVYREISGEWILVGKKQLNMFEDRDRLILPFEPQSSGSYKLIVEEAAGDIGLYTDSSGEVGFKAFRYVGEKGMAEGAGVIADRSFAYIMTDGSSAKVTLKKTMADGRDADVWSGTTDLDGVLALPPQTGGIYTVTGASLTGVGYMIPSTEVFRPQPNKVGYPLMTETFTGDVVWNVVNGISDLKVSEQGMFIDIDGVFPTVEAEGLIVTTQGNDHIEFSMRNLSSSNLVKVYWAEENEPYSDEKAVYIPVVANDDTLREYSFPVGREIGYSGQVNKLRIEVASAMVNWGHVEFGRIGLTRKAVIARWTFDGIYDTFLDGGRKTGVVSEGMYQLEGEKITFSTSQVHAPSFNVMAGDHELIIVLENESNADQLAVGWNTKTLLPSTAPIKNGVELLAIEPNQKEEMAYRIDLGHNTMWKDAIVKLQFAFNNSTSGKVRIKEILIKEK